jgi:hypothetical protein
VWAGLCPVKVLVKGRTMLDIDKAGDEGWEVWEIDASSPIKTSRALG